MRVRPKLQGNSVHWMSTCEGVHINGLRRAAAEMLLHHSPSIDDRTHVQDIGPWLCQHAMSCCTIAPVSFVACEGLDGVFQAHALAVAQHMVAQLRRTEAAEHLAEYRESLPATGNVRDLVSI